MTAHPSFGTLIAFLAVAAVLLLLFGGRKKKSTERRVIRDVVWLALLAWGGRRVTAWWMARRQTRKHFTTRPERIVKQWNQLRDEEALRGALKGSTARLESKDAHAFVIAVDLWGGKTAADVARVTDNLQSAFHTPQNSLRVIPVQAASHRVLLRFTTHDLLDDDIPWPGPDSARIADPIGVGVDEHHRLVRLHLLGQRVLIAGQSNRGKSTLLQVVIRAVQAMEDTELWLVDAKMGIELARWRRYAARFATEPADITRLVNDARQTITDRGNRMASAGLDMWPCSRQQPAIVLVIDELAELSDEAKRHLDSVVRLGRAMAVITVCATQHPSVATFGGQGSSLRAQFSATIGLGVRTPDIARMVFGEQAEAGGWTIDRLTGKGKFMLSDDDHQEPVVAKGFNPRQAPMPAIYAQLADELEDGDILTLPETREAL